MTKDDFQQKVIRNETETAVFYDLRPFGNDQREAAAVYLGEQVFRLSVNALNTSKAVELLVSEQYESTPQLEGFVEKLNAAGQAISIKHQS
ncbi:MAG: hypothetical protein WCA21_06175 [Terracidiphilus sp.]